MASSSHRGAFALGVLLVVPLTSASSLVCAAALGAPQRLWTLALVAPLLLVVPGWLGWRLARWRRREQNFAARASLLLGTMLILQALVALSLLISGKTTLRQSLSVGDHLLAWSGQPSGTPPPPKVTRKTPPPKVTPQTPTPPAPPHVGAAPQPEATPSQGGARSGSSKPFVPSFGPSRRVDGWPRSKGLAWELDAQKALARARVERKPVLVYVGSLGCPHCRKMEQGTFSKSNVQRAFASIIALAIYRRNAKDDGPSTTALRLGIIAYPQLRWLDPWGSVLPVSVTRNERRLLSSIDEAQRALKQLATPRPRSLPAGLAGALTAKERTSCTAVEVMRRAACWSRLLHADKLDAAALAALLAWETDGVTRQLVLDRVKAGGAGLRGLEAQRVIDEALVGRLTDPNDYVRGEVLKLLAKRGAVAQLPSIHQLLARLAQPGRSVANPNNLRMSILQALALFAHPSSIAPLQASAARSCRGGGNVNCVLACRAGQAVWAKHKDRGAARIARAMLETLPVVKGSKERGLGRVVARATRCALALLGGVHGVALDPGATATLAELQGAARAALGRFAAVP